MKSLFLYCFAYYLLAGIVVVIGYHRCLTHRSLKLKKWFERIIIFAGLPAGTPIQWVANHRYHHQHTDQKRDPHSPSVNGFWYAHIGWYYQLQNPILCFLLTLAGPLRFLIDAWIRPRMNQQYNHLAKDVSRDRFYVFISQAFPYAVAMVFHFIVPFGIAFYYWGAAGFLALYLTLILIYNLGDSINSFAHLYGKNPYQNQSEARNNYWLAMLTFGDGWHADHHQFPSSAKLAFQKGKIDLAWYIILILKFFRISYDIKVASEQQVQKKLKNIV